MLFLLRIRKAEDSPDDLFDRGRGARLPQAAQHIGKGAVPAFAQFLNRYDESDGALRRCDVFDVLQFVE